MVYMAAISAPRKLRQETEKCEVSKVCVMGSFPQTNKQTNRRREKNRKQCVRWLLPEFQHLWD